MRFSFRTERAILTQSTDWGLPACRVTAAGDRLRHSFSHGVCVVQGGWFRPGGDGKSEAGNGLFDGLFPADSRLQHFWLLRRMILTNLIQVEFQAFHFPNWLRK